MDVTILIVEDDPISRELLAAHLISENYHVFEADNATSAEKIINNYEVDLVLIDVVMPGIDGFTLTRNIRSRSEIGIILVTSKKNDIDRIVGLELGADDYISKPYNQRELLARVKNLIYRLKSNPLEKKERKKYKKFGDWTLDDVRRNIVSDNSKNISLKTGEFLLLNTFTDNSNVILSRDELTSKMRNRDWCPTDRSIDVLVAHLRKKLGDNTTNPKYISTIHGSGYVFIAEVELI